MPLPSIGDLQTMYGAWNPQAYWQAQDNAGLEQRYRQEELAGQKQVTRQRELANMFDEQSMPGKLENQRLTNEGLNLGNLGKVQENRKSTVEADIAEGTKQFKLNEAQRKEALAIPTHEIAMGELEARKMMMHPDPKVQEQGNRLWQATAHVKEIQLKQKNEMEKTNAEIKGRKDVAGIQAGSAQKIAQMQIDAGRFEKAPKNDVYTWRMKFNTSHPATRIGVVQGILARGIDPETGEAMSPEARTYYQAILDQDTRTLDAGNAGKIQPGLTGGIDESGKVGIEKKPGVPSVGGKQDAGKSDKGKQTSSGTKYKVVD